jgi:hypothetical protein
MKAVFLTCVVPSCVEKAKREDENVEPRVIGIAVREVQMTHACNSSKSQERSLWRKIS